MGKFKYCSSIKSNVTAMQNFTFEYNCAPNSQCHCNALESLTQLMARAANTLSIDLSMLLHSVGTWPGVLCKAKVVVRTQVDAVYLFIGDTAGTKF